MTVRLIEYPWGKGCIMLVVAKWRWGYKWFNQLSLWLTNSVFGSVREGPPEVIILSQSFASEIEASLEVI